MIKLGIGTTGKCNMNCEHCYSRRYDGKTLSLEDIHAIAEAIGIDSVNFGTGENILNPDFPAIVDDLYERGIPLSLTTNGFSIMKMSDGQILKFHDIDFSLEFPTRELQNSYRGHNSWEMVTAGMARCKTLGVPFSVATVLMNANAPYLPDFYGLIGQYGCFLRINVIKFNERTHSPDDEQALTYETFWESIRKILERFSLISCSEPILRAALGLGDDCGIPCGRASIRIQPDRSILPCVYWGDSSLTVDDLIRQGEDVLSSPEFAAASLLPEVCRGCAYVLPCAGGCASRRKLSKAGLAAPDPYCPLVRGEQFPRLSYRPNGEGVDLIHSKYLCTIILGI